jgi:hypothetical protein
VDLLVSDLKDDRPRLEQQVPKLLKSLVDTGQLMAVESEYRLQTREGAIWTHDFNRRRTTALNNEERISSKRTELLRDGTKQALKPVSLQQGTSRQPRKLVFELSSGRPTSSKEEVTLWMRDGWNDDDKAILNEARARSRFAGEQRGKQPCWPNKVMDYWIKPVARSVGITKPLGWHTSGTRSQRC